MRFVKMHGIGNDYIYLDAFTDERLEKDQDLRALARAVSDRHRGIGSDGLILVCKPISDRGEAHPPHVRMRMFNSDGSESEMCGNGIRCVAKFAHDRLGINARPMLVQTGHGALSIDYTTGSDGQLAEATVDMGEPILELERVPVNRGQLRAAPGHTGGTAAHEFLISGSPDPERRWSFVSMGNPHAVGWIDLEEASEFGRLLTRVSALETHAAFPNKANIHLVRVRSRADAAMKTWERGAGITQACGTGACAVLVAGVLTGRLDREATIRLPGGDLRIRWDEASNHVFMTGPATYICEGDWPTPGVSAVANTPPAASAIPTISTSRLVLRPFRMEDSPTTAALAGDRLIAATTSLIPHPYALRDAESFIATHPEANARHGHIFLAITTARDEPGAPRGSLVGSIGLTLRAEHESAEMGYWIGVPFWNRGFATEAGQALLRWAFTTRTPPLHRVHAYHFATNPASGSVLRKIGMKPEGTLRANMLKWGVRQDSVCYAILRNEYKPS